MKPKLFAALILGASIFAIAQQPTIINNQFHAEPVGKAERISTRPSLSVEIVDLSPKFFDFYRAALQTHASPDQRWLLWKAKYDFAAVPPIAAGQRMAREQLDAAWMKYPAALERIQRGAAGLNRSPQHLLSEVAVLLGAKGPVRIRLIAFVGTFQRGAFSAGLKDGISTIAIPLEDSDQEHALDMDHEFTHAVQMQMGGWHQQDVASAIFAEGLAMRVTQRLNPGLPTTLYTTSSEEWFQSCVARLPEVLRDLVAHINDQGAEAVSRFTVGAGAAGLAREVYCGGWFVVGRMLKSGSTFSELAHLSQADAEAQVSSVMTSILQTGTSSRRYPD